MTEDLLKKIGERVRTLRNQASVTQADLAERADLSHEFVSRIERGLKTSSLATLEKIADALGVSLGELIAITPMKKDKKQIALGGLFSYLADFDESEIRLVHDLAKVVVKHRS